MPLCGRAGNTGWDLCPQWPNRDRTHSMTSICVYIQWLPNTYHSCFLIVHYNRKPHSTSFQMNPNPVGQTVINQSLHDTEDSKYQGTPNYNSPFNQSPYLLWHRHLQCNWEIIAILTPDLGATLWLNEYNILLEVFLKYSKRRFASIWQHIMVWYYV